ncbi:MAG: aminotransferase class I/II-fold pyridoxal phosphate-dependent enzyme [Phycisphaerae bacterium]|nr:aminotransferase class I/II-fold pyridoxal phosphate-dependent enzyme [Phycisphaerae bacterium]
MNPRLSLLTTPASLEIADRVRALQADGCEVVALQTGDPDFAVPAEIVTACHKAMADGWTHYGNTRGLPALREALAENARAELNVDFDPGSEVLITNGGSHAVFCGLQALLSPGDEVVLLDPSWPQYAAGVLLAGGVPVRVACRAANDFQPDVEDLRKAVTKRTRLLILNSPCNPSGAVLNRPRLEQIAKLAVENDLLVLSDEVYRTILHTDDEYVSIASLPAMRNRTIRIDSFSKRFAMPGLRLGVIMASAEWIDAVVPISQCSITNVNPSVQLAGREALTNPAVMAASREMSQRYTERFHEIVDYMDSLQLKYHKPQGAFYFLVNIEPFGKTSTDFALELLERKQTAVVPGVSYGDSCDHWIRITFAASIDEVKRGLLSIAHFDK